MSQHIHNRVASLEDYTPATDLNTLTATAAEINTACTGITATAAEINRAADISANVETVAATNVITAAETGATFFLSSATEFVSTLPAPAAGLRYTFIVAAAPASASYTIVTNASANVIVGSAASAEDAAGSVDFEATGCDTITFVDSKAVKGDRIDVICDGTSWYATGFCSVQDAITFTTAS